MVQAGPVTLLPAGEMAEVRHGARTFVLCNVSGSLYAMEGKCPHMGAPLAQGALHEHTVVCPWHGWEFDCRTGSGMLRTFATEVREGVICIDA